MAMQSNLYPVEHLGVATTVYLHVLRARVVVSKDSTWRSPVSSYHIRAIGFVCNCPSPNGNFRAGGDSAAGRRGRPIYSPHEAHLRVLYEVYPQCIPPASFAVPARFISGDTFVGKSHESHHIDESIRYINGRASNNSAHFIPEVDLSDESAVDSQEGIYTGATCLHSLWVYIVLNCTATRKESLYEILRRSMR